MKCSIVIMHKKIKKIIHVLILLLLKNNHVNNKDGDGGSE